LKNIYSYKNEINKFIIFTLLVFSISYYVSSQEVKSVLNQEVSDVQAIFLPKNLQNSPLFLYDFQ